MLISPPFLPPRDANQTDEAWLSAAMAQPPSRLANTGAPEGSYPLSNRLAWHNGLHLQGQAGTDGQTVVRAIADGEAIYVAQPKPRNSAPDDPQNYNPFGDTPAWTDNGCVIIRHTTEIGANGMRPTEVTYYSLVTHLCQIARITPSGQNTSRPLQPGDRIWRKEAIGSAGQIYGHSGQIHFEICLDDANLTRLLGRAPAWVDPENIPVPVADGRIDTIFGSIWFYLPATTPISASRPRNHQRARAESSLGQPMWLRMTYEEGGCTFESHTIFGGRFEQPRQADVEYALYTEACKRHNSLPPSVQARSSPSGWYELLRFGRNLGRGAAQTDKDPLPADIAHWREIPGPDGQSIWADLNAEGTFKFSDADFLPICGWNFVDDDANPDDQRCDSDNLKNLIADPDPLCSGRFENDTLARRLGNSNIRQKLQRLICRFPSELDRHTIDPRYAFVRNLEPFVDNPTAWTDFTSHLHAISFPDLPTEYVAARWRVHPGEFVAGMKKCAWMSLDEFTQLLPRAGVNGHIRDWETARGRWRRNVQYGELNRVFRKYGITTSARQTVFLAQIYIETGCMRTVIEDNEGRANPRLPMTIYYAAFYGRGVMQLTWAGTYAEYGEYRGFPDHIGPYADARILATSRADWGPPTSVHGTIRRDQRQWAPRFDPEIIATNAFNACDSGAFFWIQKRFRGTRNINRLADEGPTTQQVGRISVLVNGGGNGYNERLQYSAFIDRYLNDSTEQSLTGTITAIRQTIHRGQWQTDGDFFPLNVSYMPQRP